MVPMLLAPPFPSEAPDPDSRRPLPFSGGGGTQAGVVVSRQILSGWETGRKGRWAAGLVPPS